MRLYLLKMINLTLKDIGFISIATGLGAIVGHAIDKYIEDTGRFPGYGIPTPLKFNLDDWVLIIIGGIIFGVGTVVKNRPLQIFGASWSTMVIIDSLAGSATDLERRIGIAA